jgi:hypothetical protein
MVRSYRDADTSYFHLGFTKVWGELKMLTILLPPKIQVLSLREMPGTSLYHKLTTSPGSMMKGL